jgi:hypothetical protein
VELESAVAAAELSAPSSTTAQVTRPAGYTGDGSRADSGIPPAASRQLHSLTPRYSDEKSESRDTKVWHLVIENGY